MDYLGLNLAFPWNNPWADLSIPRFQIGTTKLYWRTGELKENLGLLKDAIYGRS